MKYITAIFYTEKENKTRRDKVVYFKNNGDDARVANLFSLNIESDFNNEGLPEWMHI